MYIYICIHIYTYIYVCVRTGVGAGPRTIFVVDTCHAYSISAFSHFQDPNSEFEVRLYDIYVDMYILFVCVYIYCVYILYCMYLDLDFLSLCGCI